MCAMPQSSRMMVTLRASCSQRVASGCVAKEKQVNRSARMRRFVLFFMGELFLIVISGSGQPDVCWPPQKLSITGWSLDSCLPFHHFGWIGIRIHDQTEPADHHLLPALIAPFDGYVGIRIQRVVGRIVEVGGT